MLDLNDARASASRYDLRDIDQRLRASAANWLPSLYSNAVMEHDRRSMRCADLTGRAPSGEGSCIIHLAGERAGSGHDFATDKHAGPIDLIRYVTGLEGKELFAQAAEIAGVGPIEVQLMQRKPKADGVLGQPAPKPQEGASQGTGHQARQIERIISACVPLASSPAIRYLEGRGLRAPDCPDLLHCNDLTDGNRQYDGLVAIVRNEKGERTGGILRIFLTDDATAKTAPGKKMLGAVAGGAVQLAPIGPDGHVGIAEGLETSLAVTQLFNVPCWASLSTSGMKRWVPPANVRRVTIFADAGEPGDEAAQALAERLRATGIECAIREPLHGDDFNDDLQRGVTVADYPKPDSSLPAVRNVEIVSAAGATRQDMLTQDSVAFHFVQQADGKIRYCHSQGIWYFWNGNFWQRDLRRRVFHGAREFARMQMYRYAKDKEKKDQVTRASFAAAVERFAQADPRCAVDASAWDQNHWLLGTPAGTVELKTGVLRAADPADGITKTASVPPATCIDCPMFLAFLDEATGRDEALKRFLQQIAGYCLTGVVREHVLLFVYGPGGTGKSTFLKVLTDILATYAVTAPMTTFTAAPYDQHPTDLAMLRGARLVSAVETEKGRAWADQRLKIMTGGDPISARFMRQDFFTYVPQFKPLIVGNHAPRLHSVDDAIRRRMRVIPFTAKPAKPDVTLGERLRAEYPAILRWMIEGCLDWRENGLIVPPVVAAETDRYLTAEAAVSEPFEDWLKECCTLEPGNRRFGEPAAYLYDSWRTYTSLHGEDAGSKKAFGASLEKVGCVSHRTNAARVWLGIKLREGDACDP
jgi:putative DNA primase/helicase